MLVGSNGPAVDENSPPVIYTYQFIDNNKITNKTAVNVQ